MTRRMKILKLSKIQKIGGPDYFRCNLVTANSFTLSQHCYIVNLITFTKEILNRKLNFLCSANCESRSYFRPFVNP